MCVYIHIYLYIQIIYFIFSQFRKLFFFFKELNRSISPKLLNLCEELLLFNISSICSVFLLFFAWKEDKGYKFHTLSELRNCVFHSSHHQNSRILFRCPIAHFQYIELRPGNFEKKKNDKHCWFRGISDFSLLSQAICYLLFGVLK